MVERIKMIMAHYEMKAAQFSDAIGIQRSAVSHVLSGRNKPSLDFVLRIKRRFPEVSLDWLTMGKGKMILSDSGAKADLFSVQPETDAVPETAISSGGALSGKAEPQAEGEKQVPEAGDEPPAFYGRRMPDGEVRQMVFVYGDGTFRIFRPAGRGES